MKKTALQARLQQLFSCSYIYYSSFTTFVSQDKRKLADKELILVWQNQSLHEISQRAFVSYSKEWIGFVLSERFPEDQRNECACVRERVRSFLTIPHPCFSSALIWDHKSLISALFLTCAHYFISDRREGGGRGISLTPTPTIILHSAISMAIQENISHVNLGNLPGDIIWTILSFTEARDLDNFRLVRS